MQRMSLVLFILVAYATAALAVCHPVPGAEQIWSNRSLRWVVVGEVHGSNEAPDAFYNLVCDAVFRRLHVTVALERPINEQAALRDVLLGRDLQKAEESLLSQPDWKNGMDGRASQAMLRLLVSLRALHKSYKHLSVVAFDASTEDSSDPGERDKAMGQELLKLGKAHSRNTMLVLTGNVHGMEAPKFGYAFAAMYLPEKQRLSLELTDVGGETWANFGGACGPSQGGVRSKAETTSGIFLDPTLAPFGKVDGVLSLHAPLTSSAPAAGDPSPLPSCRTNYLKEHVPKP